MREQLDLINYAMNEIIGECVYEDGFGNIYYLLTGAEVKTLKDTIKACEPILDKDLVMYLNIMKNVVAKAMVKEYEDILNKVEFYYQDEISELEEIVIKEY